MDISGSRWIFKTQTGNNEIVKEFSGQLTSLGKGVLLLITVLVYFVLSFFLFDLSSPWEIIFLFYSRHLFQLL